MRCVVRVYIIHTAKKKMFEMLYISQKTKTTFQFVYLSFRFTSVEFLLCVYTVYVPCRVVRVYTIYADVLFQLFIF